MASTPTTRNRLARQGTGDNSGTWGTVLNGQALDLVDEALDGLTSIAISGNVTLTSTNYATDQARKRVLKLTGSPGASYIVTLPSVEKVYVVHNATNATQTVKAAGVGSVVQPGAVKIVYCDGTDCFSDPDAVTSPVGTVIDYAGASAPSGWLFCYGQAVSRSTYAMLFSVLGTLYGVGDGATTFNVPDLRGRVTAGKDDMGGSAANRLTNAASGITGTTLGAAGGAQSKTLSTLEIPTHTHATQVTVTYPDSFSASVSSSSGNIGVGGVAFLNGFSTSITPNAPRAFFDTSGTTGGGQAFGIAQPTAVLNKIIYAAA